MKINCNNCGHILEINPDTAFVTCLRCEANLLVVRTDNAVYTKINDQAPIIPAPSLEQPNPTPTQPATAEIYAAIQLLDSEWENRLPTFMTNGHLPSSTSYFVIGASFFFMLIIGLFALFVAIFQFEKMISIVILVWLFIVIIFIVAHIYAGTTYANAKKEYDQRRAALIAKLPKI